MNSTGSKFIKAISSMISIAIFAAIFSSCRAKPERKLPESNKPAAVAEQKLPIIKLREPTPEEEQPALPPATVPEGAEQPSLVLQPSPQAPQPQQAPGVLMPPAVAPGTAEFKPPAELAPLAQPSISPPSPPVTTKPEPTAPTPPAAATGAALPTPPAGAPGQIKAEPELLSMPAPAITREEGRPETEAVSVPFAPKLIREAPSVEILIDASGSMTAPFGMTTDLKMDLVKNALIENLKALADSAGEFPRNIAIRTYGSEKPADETNCTDTKLVYPLGKPELDPVIKALADVKAQGMSPLAMALSAAKEDLSSAIGDRLVIIVSDGWDNCEGKPIDVLDTLNRSGQRWIINVVAFDMSPDDQAFCQALVEKGGGKLYLARNGAELFAALDNSINSALPYNLRLVTESGGVPLPAEFTIYKAGTKQAIKKDKSYGTKLIQLKPGSYDILVEYALSPEIRPPSKIIKGVAVTEQTKVEQTVTFDLANLSLTALDNKGQIAPAKFLVYKSGTSELVAEVTSDTQSRAFFISPGTYDVSSEMIAGEVGFSLLEKDVELKPGESKETLFKFQKGTLRLSGATSQKTPISFVYRIFAAGQADQLIGSGAMSASGGSIDLYPGIYDILLTADDPKYPAPPKAKISEVMIAAGESNAQAATFSVGALNLLATNLQDKPIPATFSITDDATGLNMGMATSEGLVSSFFLPPGSYSVEATSTAGIAESKPKVLQKAIAVKEDKPTNLTIKFELGVIRVRGVNTKEQALNTKFTIYAAGTEEVVSEAPASSDWVEFPLSEGIFDLKAVQTLLEEVPFATIWTRDIKVVKGKVVSLDTIFTDAKVKIIGRGPNNEVIPCDFKIFKYGTDREIIKGATTDDWQSYSIEPGNYYMEAGYVDPEQSVLLKKWINLNVQENEIKELVLRF